MNVGFYGILILFAAFVLLLAFNPRLSCFGKQLRSPLYPLFRKRKRKKLKTKDYGFSLVDERDKQRPRKRLEKKEMKKELKTEDYGFHLRDDTGKQETEK